MHPVAKQCNYTPRAEDMWSKLGTYTVTENWTRLQYDDTTITKAFDITAAIDEFAQFKLVCTNASYRSISYQPTNTGNGSFGLSYSFGSTAIYVGPWLTMSYNTTVNNGVFDIFKMYSGIQCQLPWTVVTRNDSATAATKMITKMNNMSAGITVYYVSEALGDTVNLTLSIIGNGNSLRYSTGVNVIFSIDLYGANF